MPKLTKIQWVEGLTSKWFHDLIIANNPNSQCSYTQDSVLACCPKGEKHPSFRIYPKKHYAKCFSCGFISDNPIEIISEITKKDYETSIEFFIKEFKISGLKQAQDNYVKRNQIRQEKRDAALAFHNLLVDSVHGKVSIDYASGLLKWLDKRKLFDVIEELPLGIFPSAKEFKRLIDVINPNSLDGSLDIFKDHLFGPWTGSLIMFNYSDPNVISSFKLRNVNEEKDGTKKINFINDQIEENPGYYGLNLYKSLLYETKSIYLVEGEFDLNQWFASKIREQNVDAIILCSMGNYQTNLSYLKKFNIEEIKIVTDHPAYNGEKIAEAILEHSKDNFKYKVFEWPIAEKDPQEFILNNGSESWNNITTNEANFFFPHIWLQRRLDAKLTHIDKDDLSSKTDTILELSKLLFDHSQLNAFLDYAELKTGVKKSYILSNTGSNAAFPEGFISQLTNSLKEKLTIIGSDSSKRIHTWDKHSEDTVILSLNKPPDLEIQLSKVFGRLVVWARDNIGIPPEITTKLVRGIQVPTSILEQEKEIFNYLKESLKSMMHYIPSIDALSQKERGAHYLPVDDKQKWFFLNGKLLMLGEFDDEGKTLNWSRIESPRYKNFMFNLSSQPWSKEIVTVDSMLEVQARVNLEKIYDRLVELFLLGWGWSNPIEAHYMAALTLVYPITHCLPSLPYTHLCAERSSGKTKFIQMLCNKMQDPGRLDLGLLECLFHEENFSLAGLIQKYVNGGTFPVVDEAEIDSRDRFNKKIEQYMTLVRTNTSGGTVITRGQKDGKFFSGYMKIQAFTAAIHPIKGDADVTRFIEMGLKNDPNRKDPIILVANSIPVDEVNYIRRCLTGAMYQFVNSYMNKYLLLKKRYNQGTLDRVSRELNYVLSRSFDSILAPAAMIEMIKGEGAAEKFIYEFATAKKAWLEYAKVDTKAQQFIDDVKSLRIRLEKEEISVGYLLSLPNKDTIKSHLNGALCIHKQGNEEWLIINWKLLLPVFSSQGFDNYRGEEPHRIKAMVQRDIKHLIPDDVVKSHNIPSHYYGLSSIAHITVVNLTELTKES